MTHALTAFPVELNGRKRCLRMFVQLDASSLEGSTNSGWAHVAMLGSWEGHSKGSFAFTDHAFQQILKNFNAQSNPIPWDYEHDTFNLESTGPKPAAGWIRRLELRNNGTELWAYVDWTARAAQMIRDGEYRFCSPVVDFDSVDRRQNKEIGAELLSVALTNNPFLDGQHPLQLTWVAAAAPVSEEEKRKQQLQQLLQSAEPTGAQQPKPQTELAAPPPQALPSDPSAADAAQGTGSEADANAWLSAVADASGLDKAQTLAALIDLNEWIINRLQETVSRDGTQADARRTMSTEKKPEQPAQPSNPAAAPAQPAAAAAAPVADPPVAARPLSLDELERQRDKEELAAMRERLKKIEEERAAEKAQAIVQLVDEKIKDGFVSPDQRDNAIWAFTQDRARAEQIYANKIVPIGQRQSTTLPTNPAAAAAAAVASGPGQPIDMTQFNREELLTIDCLMGAHKTQDEAVKIVMLKRAQRTN